MNPTVPYCAYCGYFSASISEPQNALIREILAIQNTAALKKLDSFIRKLKQEEPAELSDYERQVILIGLSQVNEGNYITNEEVSAKTKKWSAG